MKKLLLFTLSTCLLFASVLNQTKEDIFNLEFQKVKTESSALKNSWLSPARIEMSIIKNRNKDISSTTKNSKIMWNQDIFRSGGILYAINYANNIKNYNLNMIQANKLNLIKQIYLLKISIEKNKLLIKQSELSLKNIEINLKIIQENYLAGLSNITDINQIFLTKEKQLSSIISLKNELQQKQIELKKLTNKNIKIKNLPLVTQNEYLHQNINIKTLFSKANSNYAKQKATISSYLPKLTLNLATGYTKFDSDIKIQNYNSKNWSAGLTLSIPLDYNYHSNIESTKIEYLKSQLNIKDKKNELIQNYKKSITNIKFFQEKIRVVKQIQKSYKNLLNIVKEKYKQGLKTIYDIESLENSVKIEELEVKIQKLNIKNEKIKLYFEITQKKKEK